MRFVNGVILFLAYSTGLISDETKKAPDFVGITSWINSEPLHMRALKGNVVLIDFWDYSCINCIRTLPHITRMYQEYKNKGFVIIGVHTPEFAFEHIAENVEKAVKRFGIFYPVAMDNDYKTWRAYNNKYWPTSYLIDKEGTIRLVHIGEGGYTELENNIRSLLNLPPIAPIAKAENHSRITPELYLGSARAQNYTPEIELSPNTAKAYTYTKPLNDDSIGLKGLWRVSSESITSAGTECSITLKFTASQVHIVLSGQSQEPITLLLDGKELTAANYTADMDSTGSIILNGDRKYDLVHLPSDQKPHELTINVPAGISAYSFTFSP